MGITRVSLHLHVSDERADDVKRALEMHGPQVVRAVERGAGVILEDVTVGVMYDDGEEVAERLLKTNY